MMNPYEGQSLEEAGKQLDKANEKRKRRQRRNLKLSKVSKRK